MAMPALEHDKLPARVAAYLGGIGVTEELRGTVATATTMVTDYVGVASPPLHVASEAVVKVAAELWYQRDAPNGIRGLMDSDGATVAVRVTRDPLTAAAPLLRPYVGLPFG